jgi:hypothetical protein
MTPTAVTELAISPTPMVTESASIDGFVNCDNGTQPALLDQEFKFPGDLLFMKRDRSDILALNGETHEFTSIFRLPQDGDYDMAPLSRDGKNLVISFRKPSDKKTLALILLSSRGAIEHKKIPLPSLEQNSNKSYSWSVVDWVNDEYMQGSLFEDGNIGDELSEIFLLDPYQLKWKTLSEMNNNLNKAQDSGFSISPDFEKIIYVNQQYQLILSNSIQNKTLWEYSDYDGIFPRLTSPTLSDAVWSRDGQMLALPITEKGSSTLLIFNKNGRIINSLNFGNNYQFGLNWSEDDQFISFYENRCVPANCADKVIPVIRIMSIKDSSVKDLRSLADDIVPTGGVINDRIIWSPDQKFLVYTLWSGSYPPQNSVILQKVGDSRVRMIKMDNDAMVLLGWSKYHWVSANPIP